MSLPFQPPQILAASYAIKGIWLLLAVLLMLSGYVGWAVSVHGAQIRLPLIGTIGPEGWKPYAERLEGQVVRIRLQRDLANSNHRQTKTNYRAAQAEAERKQAAYVVRVELEKKEAIDAATFDLRRDRERIRAQYRRLLDDARSGAGGYATGETGDLRLPGDAGDRSVIAEATGCYGLSGTRPVAVQLKCDQIASDQAAQLNALIDAVDGIAAAEQPISETP
ncbi:hypothetical protein [Erythrobacter rubeus]|uniref:OmpH family outer membrane protein n=1 Tax=Erythrobacter rubeus TaxID=2760803 RepID=A0ABR8KTN6_9SPHN|nr:hypothetical protein [Erythrobacter rubeus]MBD2842720.1 hypothetical protein [Erythrobacter rubeus]